MFLRAGLRQKLSSDRRKVPLTAQRMHGKHDDGAESSMGRDQTCMTSGSPFGVCMTAGDAWKTFPTPCPQNSGTTATLQTSP